MFNKNFLAFAESVLLRQSVQLIRCSRFEHLTGSISEPFFPDIEFSVDRKRHLIGKVTTSVFYVGNGRFSDAKFFSKLFESQPKGFSQLFDAFANRHVITSLFISNHTIASTKHKVNRKSSQRKHFALDTVHDVYYYVHIENQQVHEIRIKKSYFIFLIGRRE
nr:MAG TPA: hypothetical protein [Caudoviricetes sp.]